MTRVTVVLKTNEGGMWILPQVAELLRRGHDVSLVVPPGAGRLRRALDASGFPVEESPFNFSFRPRPGILRDLLRLRRLIRRTAPGIVFYHLYASALAARLATAGLPVRRVHMVAGPLYLESPSIRRVERVLCRMDHHLIAGSDHTARLYRRIGMSADRLSSVPYGVDLKRFAAGADQRVELFGCSPDAFIVAMVAYVYAPKSAVHPGVGIKGHDVLLDAWRAVSAQHPNALLVLVGSGFDADGEAHRQRLLTEHAVAGNPNVLWWDSVDDVRPVYSSSDLSVSPSLSENHGAALEASAMGLPCIVSDAGGLPETVIPESGWVVPAGDRSRLEAALLEAAALHRTGGLVTKGDRARELMVERFDLARSVERIGDALEGALAPTTAARRGRTWCAFGRAGPSTPR